MDAVILDAIAADRQAAVYYQDLPICVLAGLQEKSYGAGYILRPAEARNCAAGDVAIVFSWADTGFGHAGDRRARRHHVDHNLIPLLSENPRGMH